MRKKQETSWRESERNDVYQVVGSSLEIGSSFRLDSINSQISSIESFLSSLEELVEVFRRKEQNHLRKNVVDNHKAIFCEEV